MTKEVATFDFSTAVNTKLVGLAGTLNAGKDTGAEHLAERHGFMHVSTGDILREEARRYGLDTGRNTLIDIGINLRRDYGSEGALVIMAIEKWQAERERYMGGLVVTGMRAIGEADEVPARHGKLYFVDAPVEVRYRRMVARQRDSEATLTFEEFAAHDRLEFEGAPGEPARPNLRAIMEISNKVLLNDRDDPELFLSSLDEVVGVAH